jgi:hypothetical protein
VRAIAIATFGLKSIAVLFAAFWVLLIVGDIWGSQWKDVSREPEHAARVGERCTVVKGLRAHGVTKAPGPNEHEITDYVTITPLPGIGGREITFEVPLPKGLVMWVTGVHECWNCPFDRIRYAVTIAEVRELAPYPVFARTEALAPDQVHCVKDVSPAAP